MRLQSRARTLDPQADWLGVPWHGRPPGRADLADDALETTTLAMVRGAFGLTGEPPPPTEAAPDGLADYADRAWDAGLLPVPIQPPGPATGARTTIDPPKMRSGRSPKSGPASTEVSRSWRWSTLACCRAIPPHEAIGDQPMVVIGKTPTGLVYSDPSFSSSLGYGLELSDADFLVAWQAASTPRQALAFTLRPPPLARDTHLRMAEPPPVYARVLAAPAPPTPEVTPAPLPRPTAAAPLAQQAQAPVPGAAEATARAEAVIAQTTAIAAESNDDPSWMIILGAAAAIVAALAIRRLRARRSA